MLAGYYPSQGLDLSPYPTKPIRVIIPYPPGGVDNQVRLLTPSLEKSLGQPWIIDYRPGAGGQVPIGFITYSVSKGFLASGKWKLIGVTNTEPNSRAMAPSGVEFVSDVVPGFEASPQWLGFGGPAGMPRPIVTRTRIAISRRCAWTTSCARS